MCFFCPETPPEKATSRNPSRAAVGNQLLGFQSNPNTFVVPMKKAMCAEPCCCLGSFFCAPWGCTACWARKRTLELVYPAEGMDKYICCQGYMGTICCCIKPAECCQGSPVGLCLEGCCCPVMSLSIARLFLMDKYRLKPDPCDYQLIQCANCLQLLSCILHIVACIVQNDGLDKAAEIFDLIADCFTLSVAGCMGAQINAEIREQKSKGGTETGKPADVTMVRN